MSSPPFFIIQDNVPIPPRTNPRKTEPGPVTKALRALRPTQCVLIPLEWYGVMQSSMSWLTRNHGRKFTRREVEDGIMVWRNE